jgi:hypothetical protein
MNALLRQLLRFKPDFLPGWLYVFLLILLSTALLCVFAVGMWFVSTQIDFM